MQFRFTIFHDILYPLGEVVNEPDGWQEARHILERHEDFHSLIERYEGEFIWYGRAKEIFREIELAYGVDEKLRLLIEISEKTNVWETEFDGLISLSEMEENANDKFYKTKAPIIRDDFWTKLINRKSTQVNLKDSVDVDGNARTPINPITLPLPSQILRQKYERETGWNDDGTASFNPFIYNNGDDIEDTYYAFFDTDRAIIDEIEIRPSYGIQISTDNPEASLKYLFKAKYGGTYDFEFDIKYLFFLSAGPDAVNSGAINLSEPRNYQIDWFYSVRLNGESQTPVLINSKSGTVQATSSSNPITETVIFDDDNLDGTLNITLSAGDEVYFYAVVTFGAYGGPTDPSHNLNFFSDYSADPTQTFNEYAANGNEFEHLESKYTVFKLVANTSFTETETEAFLLKDAFESVLSKITGNDAVVVSDYFATCKKLYAIMKGLHVRGYSMDNKIFTQSLNDLWEGADPAFNLGLTYEEGLNQVRIEDKSYFYDKNPIINLGNIFGITKTYNQDLFFKNIEIGFAKWSLESESGIDDHQTKREYRANFKSVGKDIKLLSKFFAASLGIEQTRRNRVEEGKDWRGDEETMIIALKDLGGGNYTPELGDSFTNIENLLNPLTRYNVRLGAAFSLDRWLDWLSGCMAHFPDKYYFSKGEGNYDVETTKTISDCDGSGTIVEDQDFSIDAANFIKLPRRYEFEHPMTYEIFKIIRANRDKAVGLSRSNSAYTPHSIERLEYMPAKGKALFVVDLAVIPTPSNGYRYLEDDNFVIFGTEGLLYQDGEMILFQDGETALVGLDV